MRKHQFHVWVLLCFEMCWSPLKVQLCLIPRTIPINWIQLSHQEKWDGDLGALASMDGEDSLLFPMLDYPRERQESSKDCGLSGNVLNVHHYQDEGMPHASECVLCSSNPVAIFHGCQGQPQCNSSWTQRHRICKTGNSLTQRYCTCLYSLNIYIFLKRYFLCL